MIQPSEAPSPSASSSAPVRWPILLFATLAMSIAVRMASFGDPTLHIDEEYYFYVGQRMLHGALPYVELWDRKPLGLFLAYAAIASISKSVIAYQVAAAISAGFTAFLITRIIAPLTRQPAQIAAAFAYLAMLPWLGGFGGQAPVFYNGFMAGAALLIVRALPELGQGRVSARVYWAIALTGIALTFKQTVVVEAAFLGLFALYWAVRNGLPVARASQHLIAFAALGVGPFALTGIFYASIGHWAEFYQAMVGSNLGKASIEGGFRVYGARTMAFPFLFPFAVASAGFAVIPASPLRTFLFGWLCASVAALLIIPNFYWHYGLPVLLPVCASAALGFQRWPLTAVFLCLMGVLGLWFMNCFDVGYHRKSIAHFKRVVELVNANAPRGTLLVYDGPVYVYAVANVRPVSRIIFPNHYSESIESGTTGRTAEAELSDALSRKPSAVLFKPNGGYFGDNPVTRKMMQAYVDSNCTLVGPELSYESVSPRLTYVYGKCRP